MDSAMTLGKLIAQTGGSIKTGPFGTMLKAWEYSLSGVPLISVGEVGFGSIRLSDKTPRVSAEVVNRLPEYLLRAGDVVFGRKGGVDRSAWLSERENGYFLGSDGIRVRFGTGTSSRFMAYQLGSPAIRSWLLQHASGSTMPSLNQAILERIPLVVFNLRGQHAIAEVLGSLDDKIAANERLTTVVDERLAAKLTSMSVGRDTVTLSSIARVNVTSTKPVPGGSLRYMDISSVRQGRYEYPEESAWEAAPGRARRVVSKFDTVWSTVRPNRRSHALVLDDDPLLVASTGLAVLTPNEGRSASLYEATKRPDFESFLLSVAEGSAYPAVRADRFAEAPIPALSDAEWDEFEALALPTRALAHSAQVESRRLASTRDELLPLLMSGKVRIKEIEGVV